jgi:tripartite-type tricarboxylate transporter receptor subunit TctC
MPNVPTMEQSGYGSIVATYWNGLLAPARTPPDVVAKLNAAVNAALAAPDLRAALQKLGSNPKTDSSQAFASFIAAETQRWGKVVRDANIKVD